LRCEAEGDAPLDLSWRARDSKIDPNYDVRFVLKLIARGSTRRRLLARVSSIVRVNPLNVTGKNQAGLLSRLDKPSGFHG